MTGESSAAAQSLDMRDSLVEVGNGDIHRPEGRHARVFSRRLHQAGDLDFPGTAEDGVRIAGALPSVRLSSQSTFPVERFGGLRGRSSSARTRPDDPGVLRQCSSSEASSTEQCFTVASGWPGLHPRFQKLSSLPTPPPLRRQAADADISPGAGRPLQCRSFDWPRPPHRSKYKPSAGTHLAGLPALPGTRMFTVCQDPQRFPHVSGLPLGMATGA